MSFEDALLMRALRFTILLYFEHLFQDAPVSVVTYELSEFTIILGEHLFNYDLFRCRLKKPS